MKQLSLVSISYFLSLGIPSSSSYSLHVGWHPSIVVEEKGDFFSGVVKRCRTAQRCGITNDCMCSSWKGDATGMLATKGISNAFKMVHHSFRCYRRNEDYCMGWERIQNKWCWYNDVKNGQCTRCIMHIVKSSAGRVWQRNEQSREVNCNLKLTVGAKEWYMYLMSA